MKKIIKTIWKYHRRRMLGILFIVFVIVVFVALEQSVKDKSDSKDQINKVGSDYQGLIGAVEKAMAEKDIQKADFYLAKYMAKSFRENRLEEGLNAVEKLTEDDLLNPISYISGRFYDGFIHWFIIGTYAMWNVPEDDINEQDFSFKIAESNNENYWVSIIAYPYSEGWIVIEPKNEDTFSAFLMLGDYEREPIIVFDNLEQEPATISLDVENSPLHYIWPPEFYDLDNDNIPEIWIRYNLARASGFSQQLAIYKITDDNELSLIKKFGGSAEGIARRLKNGQIEVGKGVPKDESEGHLTYSKTLLTIWEYRNNDFYKKSEEIIPHILWDENWVKYYENKPAIDTANVEEQKCGRYVDFYEMGKKVNNNKKIISILRENCEELSWSDFYDFDNDGEEEIIMVTLQISCGSCHGDVIRVVKGDDVIFEKGGDDSAIRIIDNGFEWKQPIRKDGEGYCCPSEGIIETYKFDKEKNEFVKMENERIEAYKHVDHTWYIDFLE